jgi:2'-5' RNA ligase
MRLFVAVEFNADVRSAAARVIDEMRGRTERLAPRTRVTWVAPERMHLTLQFIGEADEARTSAIEAALESSFDLDPFDVRLAGTGAFPDVGRPRVIWAGITAGGGSLIQLAELVSARLVRARVSPDDRPFRPHLTLGRVREAAGLRAGWLLDGLDTVPFGVVRIRETVLFESRQSARGPDYVARRRTRLAT